MENTYITKKVWAVWFRFFSLVLFAGMGLLFIGCPNGFGYYPNEEDRVASYETTESSPPGAVAAPYFLTRKAGSSDEYTVINGTTVMFGDDHEIIISSETAGATLYYTTDGSNPDVSSPSTAKYSSNVFSLGSSDSITLNAQGLKALLYPSSISSLTASVATGTTSTPTFNIPEGTYVDAQVLSMSCSTTGSKIWYEMTNDGTEPSNPVSGSSSFYKGAIDLNTPGTTYRIKVIASAAGYFDSNIVELTFFISGYNVVYSANGATSGSVPVDSNGYFTGTSATVLGNTGSLAKSGCGFAGWNTQADGSGTSYTVGSSISIGTGNSILYAEWAPICKVSYNGNGATTGSVPFDSTEYLAGTDVTVKSTGTLDKSGAYAFMGWNTQADGRGTSYAAGAQMTIASNTTLYAQWSPSLLKNPSFFDGSFNWTITAAGTGSYVQAIRGYDGGGRIRTSYSPCYHSQTVDLIAYGFSPADLENSSTTYTYSAWLAPAWGTSGNFSMKIELLDGSNNVLDSLGYSSAGMVSGWNQYFVALTNSSSVAVRKVRVTGMGDDGSLNWAGYDYGAMFSAEELTVLTPMGGEMQ